MKKHLFLAAVVGMALTGCVNEESENLTQQQAKKISFDTPVMGTQTRAVEAVDYNGDEWSGYGEVTGTAFPKAMYYPGFMVFANMHEGAYNAWSEGKNFWDWQLDDEWDEISETFDVRQFSYDKDTEEFKETNDDVYYYPNDYHLSFNAYAPSTIQSLSSAITCDDEGLTINDYQSFPGNQWESNLSSCVDLMYTGITSDYTAATQPETGVPLVFNHTLSSIAVVLNIPTGKELEYSINSISITGNFITTATFKENYGDETAGWLTDEGESQNMTFSFDLTDMEPDEEGKTIYTLNGGESALLMIPQDVPTEAIMTVSYTMTKASSMEHYLFTKEIKLKDFLIEDERTIETWEMGNRYRYIVNFAQNVRVPLKFAPSIKSDWIEGGDAEYTITN